jgi:hypothetical protein
VSQDTCGVPEVGLGMYRDWQAGIVAAIAPRLLYLIFSRVLDSLTLLSRASCGVPVVGLSP